MPVLDPNAVAMSTPDLSGASVRQRTDFPQLAPNAPFLLAYHPARWTVSRDAAGKYHAIPVLGRLDLTPGVDRVDRVGGRPAKDDAVSAWRARGWTVLEDSSDYLRAVPVVGGHHHLTAFESAFPGDSKTETDTAAYATWILGKVGKDLPAPAGVALRRLRAKFESDLLEARDAATHSPRAAATADRLEASIKAVDAAIKQFLSTRTKAKTAKVEV